MTDRPMLYSAPMVRAMLDDRKIMSRRMAWREAKGHSLPKENWRLVTDGEGHGKLYRPTIWQKCKAGDLLWVRETWRTHAMFDDLAPRDITAHSIHYDADGVVESGKVRQSIFMPRRYSRLTLEVTATKMEPLLDISEEDARLEGFEDGQLDDGFGPRDIGGGCTIESLGTYASAAGMFYIAWQKLHPDWDGYSSPEVVALSFRVHQQNIDQYKEAA